VVASASLSRAAELAAAAVAGCDMSGRPMGAANQALPSPDEPHLRLWQALTAIREHRGDGHVHQLVVAGVAPSEALVLQAASGRSPEDGLRANRGWSDDDWSAATASLIARGIGDAQAEELSGLLRPLAESVMAAEVVPAHNNMGVPWPPP
jgi:hypothetical protein